MMLVRFAIGVPHTQLERVYPHPMDPWVDFEQQVRSFPEPAIFIRETFEDLLYTNLNDSDAGTEASEDERERHQFINQVVRKLQWAGMLHCGSRRQAHSLNHTHPLGNADYFLVAGRDKTVPVLCKAMQDLPEKAVEMTHRYNAALLQLQANRKRTTDWTIIGRPAAQLVSYMFLARSRYGMLCSASQTYFFKVEVTDGVPKVSITDAWFVEHKDYLRALSYFYDLAKANGDFELDDRVEREWPTWTPGNSTSDPDQQQGSWVGPEDRDGAFDRTDERPSNNRQGDDAEGGPGGSPNVNWLTWLAPSMAPSIPRVDSKDIKFIRLLGSGTNAAYLAHWKGAEVAIKFFDVYRSFQWFEREVRAYEVLKDAWGGLVPKPYFVAEIYGVVLLGMQLGRSPNSSDVNFESEKDILFRTLRRDFGIHHLDQYPRNVIYLPDASGTGKDRLVAIDFEHYEIHL